MTLLNIELKQKKIHCWFDLQEKKPKSYALSLIERTQLFKHNNIQ
jgi:hypothetical protein